MKPSRFIVVLLIISTVISFLNATPAYADTGHCGNITSDETWTSSGNVHVVTCDVTISSGITLTIGDGAIVKFGIGANLITNGTLRILGSSFNPVYLTSIRDDTVGGDTNGDGGTITPNWSDWRGVEFRDGSNDTNSLIDRAVIRYAGGYYRGGVNLVSASPTISNTIISDGYIAVRANLTSLPNLNNNTFTDNYFNALGYDGGTINANTTWDVTDTNYYVIDDIFVGAGTSLTIQPGVIVKFEIGRDLIVDGTLRILGSSDNPVYLTSIRDDTVGGDTTGDGGATTPNWSDWRGVEFRDGSNDTNSLIDRAVIRYAGGYYRGGVNLVSASPTISNTIISDGYIAVRANLTSLPNLNNNTFTDNYFNALGYDGGTINANTTWDVTDTSYYVIDDIFVGAGISLTIQPGVIVKFEIGRDLIVDGTLRILGSSDNPVYLTSIRDDTVGGDTTGDGGATTPNWSDWRGVEFRDGSNDTNSLIDRAVIRYAGGYYRGGVNLVSASPTISNTIISDGYIAVRANLTSLPNLNNNTFTDNYFNALGYDGGTINANTTWDVTDTNYYVIDDIFVGAGTSLTIQPGVIVKFEIGRDLIVDGTLRILGSSDNPVYLTSIRDDTVGGDTTGDGGATTPNWSDWRGVEFRDGSNDTNSLIDRAVIRYAGGYYRGGVNLVSASPTISNTIISDGYIAVRANLTSLPNLNNNTFTDNYFNALGYDGGTINANTTWDVTDTSYYVIDDIFVGAGISLTIQPGVIVKFEIGRDLIVDGTLRMLGTVAQPIYLTSKYDDTIGGDTNGDGGATTPNWDNWRGVEFRDGSNDTNSLVDYAVIRYAGRDYRGGINLVSASPTLQNTTLTESYSGISANSSTPILVCNSFYNNERYSLYNSTTGSLIIAENQWWGSSSGPYHPTANPYGAGNEVTEGVDFMPWRMFPCGVTVHQIYLPLITRR